MEQRAKRIKFTEESAITDIASSLDNVTSSVKSISKSFNDILRVNTAVVTYLRDIERRKKRINQTTEDLEHTSIREKQ